MKADNYTRGLKLEVMGKKVPKMTRIELIETIGLLSNQVSDMVEKQVNETKPA